MPRSVKPLTWLQN